MSAALRTSLSAGDPLVGAFIGTGSSLATEIYAQVLDWVVIDLEHGAAADVCILIQAAQCGGASAVVRVPRVGSESVAQALDAGADGVMFPWVQDAELAAAAVAQTRFGPEGERGFAPITRGYGYGRDRDAGLERPVVMTQIESASAVEAAAAIAAVDGVDLLFVGPGDLARSLEGQTDDLAGRLDECVDQVIAAAQAAGKAAGLMVEDVAAAEGWISRGATVVAVGGDVSHLIDAADDIGSIADRRA